MRAKAYGWVRYPTTIARTQSRLLARQNRVRLIVGLGTHVSCTTMRFLPARVKRAKCGAKSVRARYASRTEKIFRVRMVRCVSYHNFTCAVIPLGQVKPCAIGCGVAVRDPAPEFPFLPARVKNGKSWGQNRASAQVPVPGMRVRA